MSTNANYKNVVLIVCSFFLGLVYMSLSSWAISVPELSAAFSLSSTAVMLGSGILIAGYAIGSFVQGRLMAKIGWRKIFNVVMSAFIVATFLIPLTKNYPVILILRFIQGWGLVVTITNTLVCGWFPSRQRGMASGILLGFIALGVAIGSLLTGFTTPLYGWQFNFYLLGGLTLAGMVLFNIFMKTPPDVIQGDVVLAESDPQFVIPPGKSIYSHPVMILLGLGMFCVFFNVYGMYSFVGNFFYSVGYDAAQVGLMGFWIGAIGFVSTPFGGWVGDNFVKKGVPPIKARAYSMAVVAFLIGGLGCILMPHLAPLNFNIAVLAALISGWGCPAANGPICSLPSDVFGAKRGGEAVGFILLIAGIGGVVSPILIPYIASVAGWAIGWYVTGASAFVGFIICLLIPTLTKAKASK